PACHPERSEGSSVSNAEILRFAQDDRHSLQMSDSSRQGLTDRKLTGILFITKIQPPSVNLVDSFIRNRNEAKATVQRKQATSIFIMLTLAYWMPMAMESSRPSLSSSQTPTMLT